MIKREIVILQGAEADFLEAYALFGDRFYHLADEALEHIASFPNAHPVFFQQYHRAIIQKTPFGIFYTVSGSRVMIGAILDLRQEPKRVLDMLKRRG